MHRPVGTLATSQAKLCAYVITTISDWLQILPPNDTYRVYILPRAKTRIHFIFVLRQPSRLVSVCQFSKKLTYSVAFFKLQELSEALVLVYSIVILRDAASKHCRLPEDHISAI